MLITGSWRTENQLEMWDLREEKPNPIPIKWENSKDEAAVKIYTTQFCQANSRFMLAGGCGSNECRIYDLLPDTKSSPTVLASMKNLSRACYTVDFSNQGDRFAFSGGDGYIRVLDIKKPE